MNQPKQCFLCSSIDVKFYLHCKDDDKSFALCGDHGDLKLSELLSKLSFEVNEVNKALEVLKRAGMFLDGATFIKSKGGIQVLATTEDVKEEKGSLKEIPRKVPIKPKSVSGDVGVVVESHEEIDLGDKKYEVRGIQEVATRSGRVVQIPKKIGDSDIRIVSGGDDRELQERFKSEKDVPLEVFKKGYKTRDCSICSGTGALANGKKCPRCAGSGVRQ